MPKYVHLFQRFLTEVNEPRSGPSSEGIWAHIIYFNVQDIFSSFHPKAVPGESMTDRSVWALQSKSVRDNILIAGYCRPFSFRSKSCLLKISQNLPGNKIAFSMPVG